MIGWVANSMLVVGIGGISYQKRWGFLLATFGAILWAGIGFHTKQWDLFCLNVVLGGFQGIGWLKSKNYP